MNPRGNDVSLEDRIGRHLTEHFSVIVPPRVARWLEKQAGITDELRGRVRRSNPEAYVVLAALHISARSDSGTNDAGAQQDSASLAAWMSTSEAAKALGVTDRCIRKWCHNGTIQATLAGGRWLVHRKAVAMKDAA